MDTAKLRKNDFMNEILLLIILRVLLESFNMPNIRIS